VVGYVIGEGVRTAVLVLTWSLFFSVVGYGNGTGEGVRMAVLSSEEELGDIESAFANESFRETLVEREG